MPQPYPNHAPWISVLCPNHTPNLPQPRFGRLPNYPISHYHILLPLFTLSNLFFSLSLSCLAFLAAITGPRFGELFNYHHLQLRNLINSNDHKVYGEPRSQLTLSYHSLWSDLNSFMIFLALHFQSSHCEVCTATSKYWYSIHGKKCCRNSILPPIIILVHRAEQAFSISEARTLGFIK